MIWILTDSTWKPVATRVAAALFVHGQPTVMFDPESCVDLVVEIHGSELHVAFGSRPIELPSAVLYLRNPVPEVVDAEVSSVQLEFMTQQWEIMLRGLVAALHAHGTPVLNPPGSVLVDEKTAQLLAAARVGFEIPPTFQGAYGPGAETFAHDQNDRCAAKPFAPFAQVSDDGASMQRLLTNRVTAGDLRSGLDSSAVPSPTIVQPFIDAPFEHRVVVVGDDVVSARTARAGKNAVDVRRLAPAKADVTRGQLPTHVMATCVALVRHYELAFAAIDLLELDDGSFVFLDLNPSGHFLWVEQLTGAPICAMLAALLDRCGQARISSSSATMPV